MPLDHYVSQVHLKNFYAPELEERMYAIRKDKLESYSCDAASQCRIMDGSTNPYLQEPRVIEDFLKDVEPCYNASIEKLRTGQLDSAAIYAIAGFAAYVDGCSPAGIRINGTVIRNTLATATELLEKGGHLPPIPPGLGAESLSDLLSSGRVQYKVDPKYPQSLGVRTIIQRLSIWGNSPWDVFINEDASSPFFTSDYPIGVELGERPGIVNRIVPLAPDLAIRIKPDRGERRKVDLDFQNRRPRIIRATKQQINAINTAIVQAAETVIYCSTNCPWVPGFVKKYADFHVEPPMMHLDTGMGAVLSWTIAIRRKARAP